MKHWRFENKNRFTPKGFTFIEVLVVAAIIAVMTAVGVTNFRVANQKARDGRRQGDLQQIRAALELYRTDESEYPSINIIAAGTIISAGGTVYMENIPADPKSDQFYYYSSDGSTYVLCALLELDTSGSCVGSSCASGEVCNYQVSNPL